MYAFMETEKTSQITTAKVAWIERQEPSDPITTIVLEYFEEVGFAVESVTLEDLQRGGSQNYQIILLEADNGLDQNLLEAVVGLRWPSLALIIVLLDYTTSEDVAQALLAGADAAWTPKESRNTLRARLQALLRRWLSDYFPSN